MADQVLRDSLKDGDLAFAALNGGVSIVRIKARPKTLNNLDDLWVVMPNLSKPEKVWKIPGRCMYHMRDLSCPKVSPYFRGRPFQRPKQEAAPTPAAAPVTPSLDPALARAEAEEATA